jgi:hypothetical protein
LGGALLAGGASLSAWSTAACAVLRAPPYIL